MFPRPYQSACDFPASTATQTQRLSVELGVLQSCVLYGMILCIPGLFFPGIIRIRSVSSVSLSYTSTRQFCTICTRFYPYPGYVCTLVKTPCCGQGGSLHPPYRTRQFSKFGKKYPTVRKIPVPHRTKPWKFELVKNVLTYGGVLTLAR